MKMNKIISGMVSAAAVLSLSVLSAACGGASDTGAATEAAEETGSEEAAAAEEKSAAGEETESFLGEKKIPSGQRFLAPIIEAMRDKVVLKMTYQSFSKSHPATFTVKPYCVKVYRQRWYMLGKSEVSELRMYALDRIVELQPTGKHYRLPANFDAEAYFAHLVGVSDVKNKPEFVSVRVNKHQADYLRTLPIHDSQHEEEQNKDYSIFRYFVVPNFEFVQELRAQGSALQVLEPKWLADRMRKESKKVTTLYEDEQRK